MIPKPKKLAWYERKVTHAVLSSASALTVGAAKIVPDVVAHLWSSSTSLAAGGTVVALVAGLATFLKAKTDDTETTTAQSHLDPLKASLYTLHGVLRAIDNQRTGASDDDRRWSDRLRITLHECVGDDLVQRIDYVGGSGGKPGRKFNGRSGVIGHAVLKQESVFSQRRSSDDEGYRRELIDEWHYPKIEAMELRSDRWSFAAIPLVNGNIVTAVLYLDSSDQQFFLGNRKVIEGACLGLARYGRLPR